MAKDKKVKISILTFLDKGVEKYIGHLDKGIKRAKKFGAALRAGMHSAPVRFLRNALAGLVGTLVAGTMQAAKFNIELARAWTMSSKGEGWFRGMRNSLREMAAELGVATDQLSGGLYQALSAGVPEDNVLSVLHTAAKIAVADGSDVSIAVDGLTTVLNAFKIEASETESVADQLFNTVANGKTTFSELAQHLATVAPVAAANGIALNEVLAAVATLTKQGTPTAQAMTQIRAAIIGTNKVLGDGWAKSMKLQEAFAKIEEKAGGSQTELQKLLGTIEGVMGVMGLTGSNARMAADDLDATAGAAGKVDAAFQKVDRWRHWQKLWQSISGLVERTAQEADSRLAPAVLRIVEDIAELQDNDDLWNGLTDALDTAEEKIAGIIQFIQSGGDDAGQEVLAAVGDYLEGAAMNAGEAAMKTIAKAVPAIGRALGTAAKDAIFGDSAAKQATRQAESQADAEMGVKDQYIVNPMGGGWLQKDPKRKSEEYKARVKELEQQKLKEILTQQGVDVVGQVGTGAGALKQQEALSRLNNSSNKGTKTKEYRERRERQNERDEERRNEAREAAKEAFARKRDEMKGMADNATSNLNRRIVSDKNAVAQAALHGTAEQLEAAQSKLQSDRELMGKIATIAARLNSDSTGGPAQMAVEAMERLVDSQREQYRQLEQRVRQAEAKIKNGRS